MNNASLELGGTNWAEKDASLLGYTVSDDSGRFSPQEFTFARGSNLAATRIGKTGLIEKGRENLLVQSNQFNNTWITSNAPTLTSGQSGYDGTNDAWKMEASSTGSSRAIYQNISSSGVQTFSVYVKAGTTDWIRLNLSGIGNRYFDIGNGVVGGSGSVDGFITDVGDGWYRCSVLGNGSSSGPYIFLASANGNLAVNTGDNVYIQDAQLEQGLAASPYIPTTTTTAQAGVLENTPRLNYTTGVANPYLLLEPSRTNLVTQSEYFGGSDWISSSNVTITDNVTTSPEGVQNAALINFTSGANYFQNGGGGMVSGNTYTISCYVKRALSTDQVFKIYGNGNIVSGNFTATSEWQRFTYTFTAASTNFSCGLTTPSTCQIHLYGFQVEQATYATSYIPTYSVSATRAADACYKLNTSGEIGQTEGTMFIDFEYRSTNAGNRFSISDNSAINWIFIGTPESGNSSRFYIRANNTVIVDVGASSYFVDGQRYKLALTYKSGDWAVYSNGTQLYSGSETIPAFTNPLDTVNFKSYVSTDTVTDREKINQMSLFKERLTNAELATLTTI